MKNILTLLALCTAPLLAQASNCTGDNADAEYILGEAEGTASAMHWPTGLVWKRCVEGMTYSSGQCTGTPTSNKWPNWATSYLPKYFTDSGPYPHSAPSTQNLLASGAWRMAYKNELISITQTCGNNPRVNRMVFPDTPSSYVWSGSPYANDSYYAWVVHFYYGYFGFDGGRNDGNHVRLVRGGQSFAGLSLSSTSGPAGQQTNFSPITLATSTGTGHAWGGARISGDGNPQFQVNGGDWVQQAIVKSGDQISVRLTAPASGANTATLTLRSGQTTGTSANAANGGNEATVMQETSANFTLTAVPATVNGACGSAHSVVTLTPPPADGSLCSAGTYSNYGFSGVSWTWKCNGSNGGTQASCQAPKGYTVTPSASTNGSISPATAQVVAMNTQASFTVTPQAGYSAAVGGTCGGSLVGSTYTTAAVVGDCTVQASFAPATYPITPTASPASGGTVACTPNPVTHGQDATCSATPATGYQFTGWTGACTGTGACQLSGVTGVPSVGATFGLASAPAACASTTVLHAAPDGSGDGSSWAQAAALQQALALANGDADLGRCYEIRLRQGVYKPGPAGRPELHFAIDRPLQIKGGYTGNAAQPDERVLHASNTVLSGDIGGDDEVNAQGITEVARFSPTDGSTPLPGNQHVGINSYHVVVIGGAVDDSNGNGVYTATEGDARFTQLEGLTLTAGGTSVDWGAIPEVDSKGSGLLCNGAGAGRQCSPALRQLRFSGNYGWAGGGLFNNGQRSGNSSPVLTGVTFSGNWVAQWGSALFNNADASGTSRPSVTNSTFSGNHAFLDGAAVYNDGTGARPTIAHSTFSGNAVTDTAMGSILYGDSSVTASIVWGNTGTSIGGCAATVVDSIVQGGCVGTGILDVDPMLGPLQDNGGATPTQLPASGSPAIDAVDCAAAPTTDQRGVARPQGSRCDLGAVEAVLRADGTCGAAQGVAVRSAPGASLCAAGQTSAVLTGTADFTWQCTGLNGGATAQCTAPRQYLVTLDITGDGAATPATPQAVVYGQAAQFTLAPGAGQAVASASGCGGTLAGAVFTTAAVQADCTVDVRFAPPGQVGACGAAQGQASITPPMAELCSAGQPGDVQSVRGQYAWTCAGTQGGASATCTAPWALAGGTGARASLDLPVPGQNNGWSLSAVSVTAAWPAPLPPGARSTFHPLQLLLSGGTAAQAQVIVHYSEPVPEGAVYLKYGPSPEGLNCTGDACRQAHWYALPGAEFSPDRMSVRLLLTDGGAGDSDGALDGHITDPGLPALLGAPAPGNAQAIPTLGEWGALLLAALLGLVGLRRVHARSPA